MNKQFSLLQPAIESSAATKEGRYGDVGRSLICFYETKDSVRRIVLQILYLFRGGTEIGGDSLIEFPARQRSFKGPFAEIWPQFIHEVREFAESALGKQLPSFVTNAGKDEARAFVRFEVAETTEMAVENQEGPGVI